MKNLLESVLKTDSTYFFAKSTSRGCVYTLNDRLERLFRKLRYEKIGFNQEVFTPRVLSENSFLPEIGSSDPGLLEFVLQGHEKFARYNIVEG